MREQVANIDLVTETQRKSEALAELEERMAAMMDECAEFELHLRAKLAEFGFDMPVINRNARGD